MKTRLPDSLRRSPRSCRGIFLIDCLLYIGMFFFVTGLALSIFYRCWDDSRLVRRTANDISGAIDAGERWREDIRQAISPPVIDDSVPENFDIVSRAGIVRYRFSDGEIQRQSGVNGPWTVILSHVKSSEMLSDKRGAVTVQRWELELSPRQRTAHVRPLFTFEAVPVAGVNP